MIFIRCRKCDAVLEVTGLKREVAGLLKPYVRKGGAVFPCVMPGCDGNASPSAPTRNAVAVHIHAYYRALKGMGLCIGREPANADEVRKLLLEHRVVDVSLEPVGAPERAILKGVKLDNGVKLHFASSTRGACIYYVEHPHEYDHLLAERDSENGAEHRDESRCGPAETTGPELPVYPDRVPGAAGPAEQDGDQVVPGNAGGWDTDSCETVGEQADH